MNGTGAWLLTLPLILGPVAPALAGAGDVTKAILGAKEVGENLLKADGWRAFESGCRAVGPNLVSDNGSDLRAHRGASQTLVLDQKRPAPIGATA